MLIFSKIGPQDILCLFNFSAKQKARVSIAGLDSNSDVLYATRPGIRITANEDPELQPGEALIIKLNK